MSEFGGEFLCLRQFEADFYEVTKQALRLQSFNMGTDFFSASNGTVIQSQKHPEFDDDLGDSRLFVMGECLSQDEARFTIPEDKLDDVKEAVEEYNDHMQKLLDPTEERLASALVAVKIRTRDAAADPGYKLTKLQKITAKIEKANCGVSELVEELFMAMFSLPLDYSDALDKSPELTIWVDPVADHCIHIVTHPENGNQLSVVFAGRGRTGPSHTVRLLSLPEIDSLFQEQPLPFLAAYCLSELNTDDEDADKGVDEDVKRSIGRSFWKP